MRNVVRRAEVSTTASQVALPAKRAQGRYSIPVSSRREFGTHRVPASPLVAIRVSWLELEEKNRKTSPMVPGCTTHWAATRVATNGSASSSTLSGRGRVRLPRRPAIAAQGRGGTSGEGGSCRVTTPPPGAY